MSNLITFKEQIKELRKKLLKADDKDSVITEISDFTTAILQYTSVSFNSELTENLKSELDQLNRLKNHYINTIYNKWILADKIHLGFTKKTATGFSRKLITLLRPFNCSDYYKHGHPITDDEMDYALSFAKKVFSDEKYEDFFEIELYLIKASLCRLMTS